MHYCVPHLPRIRLIGLWGLGEAAHLLYIMQSVFQVKSAIPTDCRDLHGNMDQYHCLQKLQ